MANDIWERKVRRIYGIGTISYALRDYRTQNNMTQGDLAAFFNNNCTYAMVSDWENCKHRPSPKWIRIMEERGVL